MITPIQNETKIPHPFYFNWEEVTSNCSRIMVANQETDSLELVKLILDDKGYQVLTTSLDQVLQKAENELPDLIFLGFPSNESTLLDIPKKLKSNQKTKHIPTIISTPQDTSESRKLSEKLNADGYLPEPFTAELLLSTVKSQINHNRRVRFHKQLGIQYGRLYGKNVLFEFDPFSNYHMTVRDFIFENISNGDDIIVVTPFTKNFVKDFPYPKNIKFFDLTSDIMISQIVEDYSQGLFTLIFDNINHFVGLTSWAHVSKYLSDINNILLKSGVTSLFLLDQTNNNKNINSIRNNFRNHLSYTKNGLNIIKLI
ncbi:hypothetical protein A3K80_03765 [Candidatus Bathyarchaeota archaeon RBG_13_38_9]|nr:MAG: hypothetical protein A3K80_03765 [Candidatus Bathyarchaeota archaeon RBG_13_38_9]